MFSSVIGRCSSGSSTEPRIRWTSSSVIALACDTCPRSGARFSSYQASYKVLSRSYPGPIQVLSRSYPGPIQVLSRSYPGPIQVLSRSYPGPIQVLSSFTSYPVSRPIQFHVLSSFTHLAPGATSRGTVLVVLGRKTGGFGP